MSDFKRRIIEGPEVRKVDSDDRTVEFIASDSSVDSYGTVLPVDKWDLTRFQKNGVIGYQHDLYGGSTDPDDIIGKGDAFIEDGKLIVRITFEPAELNEKADKIFRKIQFGSIKGVSVGFAPTCEGHWGNEERGENPDVYYFEGQELLEVSVVSIPSNKNAVKRSVEEEKGNLPAKQPEVAPEAPKEPEPATVADDSYRTITLAKAALQLGHKSN